MPRRLSHGAATRLKTGLAIVTSASRWDARVSRTSARRKGQSQANISSQLIFFGTWPHQVVVSIPTQEKIVDTIDLKTFLAR